MTAAPHQLDPFAALLDQLAAAPPCNLCGGYGGAHYGWCRHLAPASAWQAFRPRYITGAQWQEPANLDEHLAVVDETVRQLTEAAGVPADLTAAIEAHPAGRRRRSRQRALQLVDTPLLREAKASVALDGDTHVVGERLAAAADAGVPRQLSLLDEAPAKAARGHWAFGNGERGQTVGEAVLRFLVERVDLDAGADAWIEAVDLAAAYNRWAAANGEPADVRPRSFGMAMTAAGYRSRQLNRDRRRFYVYDGLALLPEVDEHLADDQPAPAPAVDQQPAPVPAPTPPPAPAPTAGSWTPPTVERGAPVSSARVLPGRELPKELRDVIRPLLDDHGWHYQHAKGRSGKPRIVMPDGRRFLQLPTTPSDNYAAAKLRSRLRRMGAPV